MQSVAQLDSAVAISQWTVFHVPLFACSLLSAVLTVIAYRYRYRSGAMPLFFLLVGVTIWTATYGMQLGQTSLGPKLFWSRLTYLGVLSVPVSLFVFALTYTGRRNLLTRSRLAALCAVPVLLLVVALFVPRVLMRSPQVVTDNGTALLDFELFNPWWLLLLAYLYLLSLASIVLVAVEFVQSYRVGRFRGQTLSILFGTCIPWVLDVYGQATGLNVALAPIGLTIAGVLLSVAVFRYQLFDVSPVARRTVIENMDDGFVVVDHNGTIIDTNEAATDLLLETETLLDRTVSEVFPQLDSLDEAPWSGDAVPTEITLLDEAGRQHIYEIDTTEQYDDRDNPISIALVFRDVTEKRERQRELRERKERLETKTEQLEAQNKRLDDFASLLSHDIRNPLGVAQGYLEMVDIDEQEEKLEKVADSLDRIEQLVDEALELAKEGSAVTETETVELAKVVGQAWKNVDTTDATLDNEGTGVQIEADPSRLQRLFENLFRNSVEHGSTDSRAEPDDAIEHGTTTENPTVTITAKPVDGGFCVADDGPGIPEDRRDQIFEKGYTTARDGTGFGLAIVETIVTAHDWEITIDESPSGGAAFIIDT